MSVVALLEPAIASADTGYRDFSFGTAAPAPTSKEPQSKLWINDGIWWGSLYNAATGKYEIHRLDWATQTWMATGTVIDERDTSRSDVVWDGAKLYVVSAGTNETKTAHAARLLRFSYSSATKTYTPDTGFPITISSSGTLSITLAKDSAGRLWVAFTKGYRTYIAHSTSDDATWVSPFLLPVAANDSTGSNGLEETAIVAYDNSVGVMFSNQDDWAYYFAIHKDGDPADKWSQTIAHQGVEEADNHINLKGLDGDPAGGVFAIAKTSLNASSDPLYYVLVRKSDGTWTRHVFGRVADNHTRAQLVIDVENRALYVFATSPCCNGGAIYYKKANLDDISFSPGKGDVLIESSTDTHINNATTTKQPLSGATGVVVVASDDSTDYYWHNAFDLGSTDTTPPATTIVSGPSGTVSTDSVTFEFDSSEPNSTFECSLDSAPFGACASPTEYTGLAEGSHTFEVRATDAAGNTDPSPAGRTWTVDTSTEIVSFSAAADARVEELKPDANFGTDPKLAADVSPNMESYARFDVKGLSGPVLSAKLNVFASNGTTNGPAVHLADNLWSEGTITWNTKPARTSGEIDDKGSIPSGTWVEFDVTAAVTGNGTYTFNVRPMSKDGFDFYSRESSSAEKPKLVIQAETDTTSPETTVDSGPSGSVSSTSASFSFSSNEDGSTFECSLDGSAFGACTSPKDYTNLSEATHRFEVRATDAAGNVDPSPASRSWTIDLTAPDAPTITSPADGTLTNDSSVTVSGHAEAASTVAVFEGDVSQGTTTADGAGAWALTIIPSDGSHTYTAKASDAAGNTSRASTSVTVTVDTLAPATTIDSGPSGSVSSTSAELTFSSSEAASTFECSLDGAPFSACTSPASYSALAEGAHTFEARATDSAGNTDPSPASQSWTVDTTSPAVSDRSPAPGATDVAQTTVVTAAFAEAVDAATVSASTFTLVEESTGLPASATVTYDAATRTATLDPDVLLAVGTTYRATVVGGAEGVKDLAGNPLAGDDTWTFTTSLFADTTPPETTIDSGPSGSVSSTSAEFAFSSSEPGSTFECALDGALFSSCTSPKTYTGLAEGSHTVEVRAIDDALNTDSTPASRSWTVDTLAPDAPTITSPADGTTTSSTTVTVSGTAEAGSMVEVFDGGSSQGTTAADSGGSWSKTVTGVADGSHTYTAKASDAAGNTSAASSGVTVTVDTVPPETTIDSGPSGSVASTSAEFTFSSSEAGSTFECALDGAAFSACTSPESYSGLSEGSHTFEVRATDSVGNTDGSSATRTWTIDLTIFSDGFESGDFSAWTDVHLGGDGSATVQSMIVKTGTYAAELSATANTGSLAYARKSFAAGHTELTVSGDFRVLQEGASRGNVPFFRLLDAGGTRLVSLYRQNLDGDKIRVGHSGIGVTTSGRLPLDTWGHFQLRVVTAGSSASTIQIHQDGTLIYETTTASLGTSGVTTLQIGNDTAKQAFKLVADNIKARIPG